MSRSQITTNDEAMSRNPEDWLPNPTVGEILVGEFMTPLGLTSGEVGERIGLPERRIAEVVEGRRAVDVELDLRLGRYFGMSAGFFLRLQLEHGLLEYKRAHGDDLDRIVPRAA